MLIDYALLVGVGGIISVGVIRIKDIVIRKIYKRTNISQYELLAGYNKMHEIILDMKKTPHVLIGGLSGNGKSKCAEGMLKDKLNVVLLNCYQEDFKTLSNVRRLNTLEEIKSFLKLTLEGQKRHSIPLYICIDEILMLCRDKEFNDLVLKLLAVGRHLNIFIISLVQIATKTNLPFKDMHNARITFKQLEQSAYRVICPSIPPGVKTNLKQREFIVYYDQGIENGVTYDV